MKIMIGAMINRPDVAKENLLKFEHLSPFCVCSFKSAAIGINHILDRARDMKCDVCAVIHQDMQLPPNWKETVEKQIDLLPKDWIVAGLFGISAIIDGKLAMSGHLKDARMGNLVMCSDDLPTECISLDECCLIFNMENPVHFNEQMPGFDLYGYYACLWAKKHGGRSFIINARANHNADRDLNWKPDDKFYECWKMIKSEFNTKSLITTCIWEEE